MNNHGINFVKSEDPEFDMSVKRTMVSMFVKSYNAHGNVEVAVKNIADNPILKVRGFIGAVKELASEYKIPPSMIKQIEDLYPEHTI